MQVWLSKCGKFLSNCHIFSVIVGYMSRCSYGIPILIYSLSTVYVPYINRISTVVDSGYIARRQVSQY